MKILLAPLHKIAKLSEETNEELVKISVLSLQLKDLALISAKELVKQTFLLKDIKNLIKKQADAADKKSSTGFKVPSGINMVAGGLAVVTMAAGILAATGILGMMPEVKREQLLTAILVAGLMVLLTPVFIAITEAFSRSGGRMILDKVAGNKNGLSSLKSTFGMVGVAGASMLSMAIAVTLSATVITMMPSGGISGEQFFTALKVAFIMIPLAYAIAGVTMGLKKSKLGLNKKSLAKISLIPLILGAMTAGLVVSAWILKGLPSDMPDVPVKALVAISLTILAFSFSFALIAKAVRSLSFKKMAAVGAAIPVIALAMVIAGHIFNYLPDTFREVPQDWAWNTAASILYFAVPFVLIALVSKKIGIKAMGKAVLAMVLISAAIFLTSWIFSILPETFKTPPMEWSVGAAVAITAFSIPLMILGSFAATGAGAAAIALGALGIVLVAVALFIVAWIFNYLPDLKGISKNFTDAIMYPINEMITTLVRFKNEIGIDNMLPLAGGLFAVAAGWIALNLAFAGAAATGVAKSTFGFVGGLIDKGTELVTGKTVKGPLAILQALAAIAPELLILAKPLDAIGVAYGKIAYHSKSVNNSFSTLSAFGPLIATESAAKNLTKIAKGYKSIASSSKLLNIDAIEASTKMFNAIAAISKNSGEDAITAISKELMAAVKELSTTVKNLEDVTEAGSASMADAFSAGLKNLKDKVMGSSDDSNSTLKSEGMNFADVVLAIESLQERFDSPIKVKGSSQFS